MRELTTMIRITFVNNDITQRLHLTTVNNFDCDDSCYRCKFVGKCNL
jgi:hypothetical protein